MLLTQFGPIAVFGSIIGIVAVCYWFSPSRKIVHYDDRGTEESRLRAFDYIMSDFQRGEEKRNGN